MHVDRNHTEQKDIITTTVYEPRGKSRYRGVERTERVHSEKNSSRQLDPHSIHTWAGDRHWQDENAWLVAERTHARVGVVAYQTGVSGGLDGENPTRLGCDAVVRKPRTDEGGGFWRSAGAGRQRASQCSRNEIDMGQRNLSRQVDQPPRFLA